MAEILNFSAPLGRQQLNFGADDYDNYTKFIRNFELDYKHFPIIYIEFDWKYSITENLLRFFRFKVQDKAGKYITKSSTEFLNYTTNNLVSLVLDLRDYKHLDLDITAELYIEPIKENSNSVGMENLKMYIGQPL